MITLQPIDVYEKAGFRDTGYIDPETSDRLILAYELTTAGWEARYGA